MKTFKLEITCDCATFDDTGIELVGLLREIAAGIRNRGLDTEIHTILDTDGNRVGTYRYGEDRA